MKNHTIHYEPQGTPEWLDRRRGVISGTDAAAWMLDPRPISLTIPQIKEEIERLAIPYKKSAPRLELLTYLPDGGESFAELSDAAINLLIQKITDKKPRDTWQLKQEEKESRQMEYMIQVQRGNALEPAARTFYEKLTSNTVTEVGFVASFDGKHGMSPDGLIMNDDGSVRKGIEIKCPWPENARKWLRKHLGKGTIPAEHFYQCQMGMVCCECDEWDFLGYCPNLAPLLVTIHRSEITDQLEEGLRVLGEERDKLEDFFADTFEAVYSVEGGARLLAFHNGNPMYDDEGNSFDQDGNLLAAEGLGA